ncbi:MAG: DUF4290 domain-containing protein [Flavobacteriaceae bacterium]|jgi:hypothetical protein
MNLEALEHLQYNTSRSQLIIPENGRHFQKMIDQALEVQARDERNKMAHAIVSVMGNMHPHLRDVPDFQHKLWDQLFIMSDFKLDVDAPFPKPSKEELSQKPEALPYPQNFPKYRFYGNNIKRMIDIAVEWEESDKREALALAIANHMKKCYLNWNKDTVEDTVIFEHLFELSEGKLNLKNQKEALTESEDILRFANQKHQKSNYSKKNNRSNRNKKK